VRIAKPAVKWVREVASTDQLPVLVRRNPSGGTAPVRTLFAIVSPGNTTRPSATCYSGARNSCESQIPRRFITWSDQIELKIVLECHLSESPHHKQEGGLGECANVRRNTRLKEIRMTIDNSRRAA
jgi:hypothetical protein